MRDDFDAPHDRLQRLVQATAILKTREVRSKQADLNGGLLEFVRYFWPVVEPSRPLIEGWPLEAICEHLEAVVRGDIKRLVISIPPGFMKSLTANVFLPAWEWGPVNQPSMRYIAASYSQSLTVRDNVRFRNIIMSPQYRELWGDRFSPSRDQFNIVKVANDKTGWKLASSVGGVGTGERADRFVCDDGNSVKEAESEVVRESTNQWYTEVVPTRLNSAEDGVIVNIQQRTHDQDITGIILARKLGYEHLCIPMEFEGTPHKATSIGWRDPRKVQGELAWPQRFSHKAVIDLKKVMGPYAVSGQFQQNPSPRGGGILKAVWWKRWQENDFPLTSYRWASVDTAYTEKEENDPSGFTCWGLWHDRGQPKVILLTAWRKRLELHGDKTERLPGEKEKDYERRASAKWGLCEWLEHSCRSFKVNTLIIEGKASGLSVAQELRRLHGSQLWGIETVTPEGDKVARAYAVQSLFSAGIVYAPEREWAQMVIDECASFPKGRYKDLTDSTTQALKHVRESWMLMRPEERKLADEYAAQHRPQSQPLYPV